MKYVVMLFCVVLSASAAPALEGQERGGGRQAELEFAEFGRLAAKSIEGSVSRGEGIFDEFNLPAFRAAMERTEILARSNLCRNKVDLNSGEVYEVCLDAEYIPEENRIELSEKEWKIKRCMERAALVVHEYGRASGNEDGNYRFSSRVKESDYFRVACDGWEGDQSEKCADQLSALQNSLKKIVARFEANKEKFDQSFATNVFMADVKTTMKNWSTLRPTQECRMYGEEACVEFCSPIRAKGCTTHCQVGREENI